MLFEMLASNYSLNLIDFYVQLYYAVPKIFMSSKSPRACFRKEYGLQPSCWGVCFKTAADSSTEHDKSEVWQRRIFVVSRGLSRLTSHLVVEVRWHVLRSVGWICSIGRLLVLRHVDFSISKMSCRLPPDCFNANPIVCPPRHPWVKVLLAHRNHSPNSWPFIRKDQLKLPLTV